MESRSEAGKKVVSPSAAEGGSRWWGTFSVGFGRTKMWHIGPCKLYVQRLQEEWRIARLPGEDPLDSSLEVAVPAPDDDPMQMDKVDRFGTTDESEQIGLSVALANRAVVAKPERPFHVPAGEEVTLYVSTPLWIRISAGASPKVLLDKPIYRPSDTWFGPPTREGELCYASKAFCRLRLDDLPVRPHRATTAVHLRNRADSNLTLERMKIPVAHLKIYVDGGQRLWTNDVSLERERVGDFARLGVLDKHKGGMGKLEEVAPPREPVGRNVLVRAFGSIIYPGRQGGR